MSATLSGMRRRTLAPAGSTSSGCSRWPSCSGSRSRPTSTASAPTWRSSPIGADRRRSSSSRSPSAPATALTPSECLTRRRSVCVRDPPARSTRMQRNTRMVLGQVRVPSAVRTTRRSATRPATMWAGKSAAGRAPWCSARSTAPRAWRSLPSYGAWRVLTPAEPIAGSGAGCPATCHAHAGASGHSLAARRRTADGGAEVHQHLVPRPPGAGRHERVGARLHSAAA